ncbi:ankyrin protein 3 [Fusarium globosum]|uniref:Ankyrin protein 3 n=1 Tax=Fusarium globosum TaxID=78864 RepID=A0A8H5XYQ7_9HYPO|nr:ankyrin protein 3 [Fusarium globosum]
MASSKSQATGIENIHTATVACISSLEACLSVKPLMKGGWAENRLADMNLWASGVGALARPKASLDRRLEFQPKARLVLSNLLLTLQTLIEVCRIHAMDVNSAKTDTLRDEDTSVTPADMSLVVDSESASSAESWFMELGHDIGMVSDSSSDSFIEDQSAYCDHETKLKRSMDDIDDLIDQLIMLGFAIRKSGTAARLQKADKTFNPKQNSNLRTYLESIVLRNTGKRRQDNDFDQGLTTCDRMHHANALREVTAPQNHLIIANLRRRHRFNYARRHQLDLGQQVAQPIITKSVLSVPGPTQYQSTMTRDPLSQDLDKPTMAPMGSATPTGSSEVHEARTMSETTASAVEGSILNLARPSEPATSVMSMSIRKFEYPSPPPVSKFMRGFKCPCCYQTLPEMFHESSRWRKHLTEDLCPYTCPFSDCERAEVLYISRTAWRNHVLESHGKGEYWECQACSGTVFSTAKELAEHNHLKHGSTISEDEIADLQAFCRNITPPSISHCPLCLWPEGEEVLPDAMTSLEHIGSCIHEFSLNSLPWAKSLSLQGADSTTISIPNVEEWLTGTVEKLDIEEIRDLDVRAFQPLPRPPRSPIQDPMHIPREYFAEISKYSSHAERGSHIPSDFSTNGTVDELAANDTDSATTTQSHPPRPSDRHGFEIAIICSTALEADAIDALFDRYWEDDGLYYDKEPGDPNAYSTGVIGRFNVVLVYMPGTGKVNAASVAAHCARSFPNIKLALLVGICGVVPFSPSKDEIILGDIIISTGIIHYDFGRQLPGRSVHGNTLSDARGNPNREIREVLAKLKTHRHRHQLNAKIERFLDVLRQDPELHAEYPGSAEDKLFEATYYHTANRRSCEQVGCNGELVSRSRLSTEDVPPKPTVHFGLVASGNTVMKSGEDRDRIALADDVIAFEMEGAGVWDTFPCIIIKGGCDYADSHKSQVWQRYAAATAAACAKAFLEFWNPLSNARYSSQASDGNTSPSILLPRTKENTTSGLNADFTGRQREIAQIQNLLFRESGGRSVALVGLGGMGKTQIALQFAYLIKNDKESDHVDNVIWMSALSIAIFESECSKMITQFGIEFLPGETAKDTFKRFLCSQEAGKWLLIIDNVDDMDTLCGSMKAPEGIAQFIPDREHGYILFLTRSRQVATSVAPNNIVEVSELDGHDAEALLQTILKEKIEMQDKSLIEKLLQDLAYNPLAIAQLAAYMNVNEISVSEGLSLLESSHEIRDEILGDDVKLSVIALFNRSFDAINAVNKAAAELLTFMALLGPDAIPRALLLQTESEESTTRAIETLHNYCLLQKVKDGETFHMHRLLRSAAQRWGKQHGFEIRMRQKAFVHIANVLKSANSDSSAACRDYMPHALTLLTNTEGVKTEAISNLGYWIGRCLRIGGRIRQAVGILESVVEIQSATLDREDAARLSSQHELASAYLSNGQIEEAIELLENVIAIRRILAENDNSRLASQHVLAVAYRKKGLIKEAVELLEHVVAAAQAGLAENDPFRMKSQLELASTYQSGGQIKKAIELLEHTVAAREYMQPETHPDRLATQYNLGQAYRSNGQVKEAIELLSHVVLVQADTLTEAHPDRLAGQYELAMAFQANGQSKEAIGLLEQVVAIQAETLPEDHPDRWKSANSLQEIYTKLEP